MNVISRVIWWVELDDPVYTGYIEATRSDVCTEEDACFCVTELEEGVCAFLLLLFALRYECKRHFSIMEREAREDTNVEVQNRYIDVVEELGVIFYRVTTREKDDDLLLEVLLEEGEEEEEAAVGGADNVSLRKCCDGTRFFRAVHVDVEGTGTKRYPGEVLNFCGLGSGEEHGLSVFCMIQMSYQSKHSDDMRKPTIGKNGNNPLHFFFETNLQYPVRLVDDERFEVPEDEAFRILIISEH